jgi:hypothetical protein
VITIPDIVKPELEHIHACDSIAGMIPYNGTVVGAATAAVSWISSQTATAVAGVQALVDQIPNRVVRTIVAAMGEPAEVRAYGGGAPAYTARANAIKTRGDAGSYT